MFYWFYGSHIMTPILAQYEMVLQQNTYGFVFKQLLKLLKNLK